MKLNSEQGPCLPGTMLVVYMGEQNKYIWPLLIRTNEIDTTYYQFTGSSAELYNRNGFIIAKEPMKKLIVNDEAFVSVKKYIMLNNTEKNSVTYKEGYNTFKIILMDGCDSLSYLVDGRDKFFFKNLADSVRKFSDNDLILRLKSYQERIQE